jgi:hypothetical protein
LHRQIQQASSAERKRGTAVCTKQKKQRTAHHPKRSGKTEATGIHKSTATRLQRMKGRKRESAYPQKRAQKKKKNTGHKGARENKNILQTQEKNKKS